MSSEIKRVNRDYTYYSLRSRSNCQIYICDDFSDSQFLTDEHCFNQNEKKMKKK